MQFDDSDLDTMLDATGEPVAIQLAGATVKTIQAKFRKNYEEVSPFEANIGKLNPAMTCKTSDLAGITNAHVFLIEGTEYKFDGKPNDQPSGLSMVKLGVKR